MPDCVVPVGRGHTGGQAGVDVFTRKDHRDVVIETLQYCQENIELIIYGWCITNPMKLFAEVLWAQRLLSQLPEVKNQLFEIVII